MNRYKKLLKNTGYTALGTFGSKLLVFLFVRFYTAYLTPDQYSTSDLITQTAKLLMPFVAIGITDAVFRFALDKECNPKEVFSVGVYTLACGLVLLVPITFVLDSTDYFTGFSYLIILYIFAANLHTLVTQYIRTKDHYKFYGIQGIINTGLVIVLNIIFLAVMQIGIAGYVLSVVLADFITSVIVIIKEKLYRDLVPVHSISRSLVKKMMKYGIPLIPTTVLWWVTSVSDRYIVKGFCGGDVNGIYTVAYKIPTLLVLLCTIFIQAWNFSSVAETDEKEQKSFFTTVFSAYSALMFIAGSFITVGCEGIKYILFDKAYYSATDYVPILALATVFSCLVSFIGSIYTVKKKSVVSLTTALSGAIFNIVLNFILVPDSLFGIKMAGLGALGAAIATFASYFAVFVIRTLTVGKILPFDMKFKVLTVNFVCLSLQTVLATVRPAGYIFMQLPFVAVITVINIKPLLMSARKIITGKRANKAENGKIDDNNK